MVNDQDGGPEPDWHRCKMAWCRACEARFAQGVTRISIYIALTNVHWDIFAICTSMDILTAWKY